MALSTLTFYALAAAILASTAMAITRRNLVHAVIYLIFSIFGTALLYYVLGAPFLAALQVIIYAGAIMIVFLFIIMMTRPELTGELFFPLRQWLPAAFFGALYLAVGALAVRTVPDGGTPLRWAQVSPAAFAAYIFERHWLSVEITSLLLLAAVMGAFLLGKKQAPADSEGGT